jgi:hypothetical protein
VKPPTFKKEETNGNKPKSITLKAKAIIIQN